MVDLANTLRPDRPSGYRGRFAPSPSGPLHFGSLIAALASYLDAKHNHGQWLVRIEDIDPPREQAGASKSILTTLECFGLHWDEHVLYQSQQTAIYRQVLAELKQQQLSYYCQCTRADIKANGGIYLGHCRNLAQPEYHSAIRVKNSAAISQYQDLIQGRVSCHPELAKEDFIVFRRDGLFAYQLAVVVDDIYQGISHVIRGCDLLEPTARQLSFYQILQQPAPRYAHVPLAVTAQGYKLSKQNRAPAIDNNNPVPALFAALQFLGQQPPSELLSASVAEILAWATSHWSIAQVPKVTEITYPQGD
ncbi:glutamyl-Q tRNA(Asp) synthetase [Colwellia chukchiensis]|uniref:Glutamyl-Q tRNA(Asp) synthetase n=1 Tax=Colwellia chukchiensis TaxID=641665 RepID=A0A1H7N985_9GAMM|nr:tRNA glutamyl-Q(34) synthetase GluQRS [Colwellia chukchiensis]SEL20186.1 glutamyl-Q tRNA(Asp) synthetase [Colwellia chukchiensis]